MRWPRSRSLCRCVQREEDDPVGPFLGRYRSGILRMKSVFYLGMALATLMLGAGCAPLANCLDHGNCSGDDDDDDDSKKDADASAAGSSTAPMCVTGGKPHIGLGGQDIAAQDDGPPGGDRARVKPFTALVTE